MRTWIITITTALLFNLFVHITTPTNTGKLLIASSDVQDRLHKVPAGWKVVVVRDHIEFAKALEKGSTNYVSVAVAMHGNKRGLKPSSGGIVTWEHYNTFLDKLHLNVYQISCRGERDWEWDGGKPFTEGNIKFLAPKGTRLHFDLADLNKLLP